MKSDDTKKPFPASSEDWEQLISEAPGSDQISNSEQEQAFFDQAVVIREGGPKALVEALKNKRGRGQQKAPVKQAVSIRLSADVMDYFKATGKGWQTRVDQVLREYMDAHH